MLQVIDNVTVEVVDFDTMPVLPITGLTAGEQAYKDLCFAASYPHGIGATLAAQSKSMTYAEALTHALETGVITEPGKYGIHLIPGTFSYKIYQIIEP